VINGRIINFSILIKISPGNDINIMAFSDGSAIRKINPRIRPANTLAIVKVNNRLSLPHFPN
jgi:hypothetical protein